MKLNKKSGAFAGLFALAAVGGTLAYFNQTAAITNPFATKSYAAEVVEHFNPADGEDWKPGAEVEKMVGAKNTGDYPVLVRIRMDEEWSRGDAEPFKTISSVGNDNKTLKAFNNVTEAGGFYTAHQKDITDGIVPTTLNANDGDDTVVHKALTVDTTDWMDGGDGYWYWNGIIEAGKTTDALMTSVRLASNTDFGKYEKIRGYYTLSASDAGNAEDGNGVKALNEDGTVNIKFDVDSYLKKTSQDWTIISGTDEEAIKKAEKEAAKEAKENNGYFFRKSEQNITEAQGYANAEYDLTIHTQFIQATKDAVASEWKTAPEAITGLAGLE
ncbi:BsaA family SipW-dependent biofilm matrix protein [Clostridium transplantifaecale]|uniref:BsaA family SipW-dependent biofilm matrix protein n=1 Tax=Clostridium transplantifaecale TaxID=2479838 RepID=UPI000F62CD13|nr:BsaA family SipW-dependent biofilm matrix protein [Clostridium transplantifaecale]